jgi:hypothetical protein
VSGDTFPGHTSGSPRLDDSQSPVGKIGRVTVPIPTGGLGEILVSVRGGSEAFAALSDRQIGKNTPVLVVDMASARTAIVVAANL